MANNLYLHAKALAQTGHDVLFIREREDPYPFSQPFWEDLDFTFDYEQLNQPDTHNHEHWTQLEASHGWRAPDWLWDPLPLMVNGSEQTAFIASGIGFSRVDAAILEKMKSCDGLIVCGGKPCILAMLSGKPYVIQPAGGEMMVAARLLRLNVPANPLEWLLGSKYERLVRKAFHRCRAVGVHDPRIETIKPLNRYNVPLSVILPWTKMRMLGTHTDVQKALPDTEKKMLRASLAARLGIDLPDNRLIVLVPSRVDFKWKGHDRLVDAFKNPTISKRMHFVFSAWGDDYPALKAMAEQNAWSATFLNFVMSKQLLYKMINAVDIVVDNFVSGHYGTTGAEALGRGTTVMMWCEKKQYTHPPGLPPVLQCRSREEIEARLLDYIEGCVDIDDMRRRSFAWAMDRHAAPATSKMVIDLLR